MIRIYKNINIDGEHRLVGTPSNFSTAFSSNKIYETNDVGKFVQPNAREIIVPYFAEFKSASVIESVVSFTNASPDYTFFRVTGYEFSGINNIKYYIVVDPFLTFHITVSGLLFQTSDKYKYDGKFASPAIGGQCVDKKHNYSILSMRFYVLAFLDTNSGSKAFRTLTDSFYTTYQRAERIARNNKLISGSDEITYTTAHIYLIPTELDLDYNAQIWTVDESGSPNFYLVGAEQFVTYTRNIIVPKEEYNVFVGTVSKKIKVPDYRLMYSFSGQDADVSFPVKIQLSTELNAVIRLYIAGENIEIQDDFEVDLVFSQQSQYEVFKRMSDNIRLGTKIGVGTVSAISAAAGNNYMAAISGVVNVGQDIANIWANEIERNKQVAITEEKTGNVVENYFVAGGVGVFYNLNTELENKADVDAANDLYGYIPLNLINCTDDPLASPIASSGTYIYYRFSQITDISNGNIPLEYIEEIKSELLRGVFIMHY